MADATPTPFEPPAESIEQAVAQQLDFAARLDALERKQDQQLLRTDAIDARLAGLQVDVSRVAGVGTTNQLTLNRVEKGIGEIQAALKRLFGGQR